jgi:hypothetical protein
MAETRQELTAKKAKRKTGSSDEKATTKASTKATTNASRNRTRKKKSEGAAGDESACRDGAERLRWAADRRLGRNSAKLADLLTKNALKGDLASTKVLLGLAEGKKPIPEKKGPVRSLALRLAAEPQCERPVATCGGADGACAPGS